MKISTKKVLILWLPVIIWMVIIFLFSSMQTRPVSKVYWSEFLIKKSAHVVEYFTLSALFYRGLVGSGIDKKKAIYYSFIFSFFYAMTDEYHQSFTPGREPKIRDVAIDTSAVLFALLFISKYLPVAPSKIQKLAKQMMFL